MSGPSQCPSCFRHLTCEEAEAPYAIAKLIPAGTLIIDLDSEAPRLICNHTHVEDGWHPFQRNIFQDALCAEDEGLFRRLDFLIKHRFISVTYRLGSSTIYLRIYIIPYDLGNVHGKLRIRKEAILAPARRYLRALLPRISQDLRSWYGDGSTADQPMLLSKENDSQTLSEIYGNLASPHAKVAPGWEAITGRLLDYEDNLGGFGMRSKLYKYQRRSVIAMMQRELDPNNTPDPLFIPLTSMKGETFYFQPGTMEILQECPAVAPSRGGILCEELGTGKTVIILALVLATLKQVSTPEESIIDDRPVMTPLSFRHFPSPECVVARKRFFYSRKDEYPIQTPRIPSFVELLMHRSRTAPDTTIANTTTARGNRLNKKKSELIEKIELIRPGQLLAEMVPFYHHYRGEPTMNERAQRNCTDPGPRIMYLTSATLIVVPPNLLTQWSQEIQKHCEYAVRVLVLRRGTPLPSPMLLASDYDIILMTYPRYTAENDFTDTSMLHSWKVCHCPELPGSRVPKCDCKEPDVSGLLQIRWKRLVIDEGHVSASLSTILTPFTKLLSVERRWIVTGTPTTNLLGLSLGKKISEDTQNQAEDDEDFETDTDEHYESLKSSSASSRAGSSPPTIGLHPRIWNKYDRRDLSSLGKMITHFIAVPQFTADSSLVQTHIIEPLLDNQGPRRGAIQVLNRVMEMIMVRHRIEDVEDDVVLPPVKKEAILLDLDPYAVKSYNALQATIAINAVDSQRTDQDYMFHPRNVDHLQVTVKNISQLMFWSTDDGLYNADELSKTSQAHIDVAIERKVPQQDLILLENAFKHVKLAAGDPLWRAMQSHEDVPYRVYEMNRRVFDAWTRIPQLEPTSFLSPVGFLHADRLLKLHDLIISRPRIPEEDLVRWGRDVAWDDRLLRKLFLESQKKDNRKAGRKATRHHDENNASFKSGTAAKKANDPDTLKEMQKELDASGARLGDLAESSGVASGPSSNNGTYPSQLVASSLLAQVRLGCTASSKLNYIINEVIEYAPKEKFLIFSDSPLSLAHLGEALELIQVKFLRFTTQVEPRMREQMVMTFETSEKYRVFLMELKHGARGLNLISASRVIFCEPVWQADVESQAIKRAHRIGQTRSITVKTLAIRGTAEENMVARRNTLKESQGKLPKLIEEEGMRHFIANPTFIENPPERIPAVDVHLFSVPPVDSGELRAEGEGPTRAKRVRIVEPIDILPSVAGVEPRSEKRKGVRFE